MFCSFLSSFFWLYFFAPFHPLSVPYLVSNLLDYRTHGHSGNFTVLELVLLGAGRFGEDSCYLTSYLSWYHCLLLF